MKYENLDSAKVGEKLRELRERSKETIDEVAKSIETSSSAISMYESGRRMPRDDIKIRIAEHFCVPVESIFFPKK